MKQYVNPLHHLIITLLGAALFIPFLGDVHLFDWDEINFAESAREMIMSGNYSSVQINYNAFWEKPPMFIWLQVLSMKIFGINEFAARFPNALFGILTLNLIYRVGKQIFKGHIAHWWVLSYIGAIFPHLYFKTGLIDPVFNFFIFLGILELYKALEKHADNYNTNRHFLFSGIYTGLAILCKGPVALLVHLLVMFSLVFAKRMIWYFNFGNLLIYLLVTFAVSSIWFLPETLQNGPYFIIEFIQYQLGLFSQNIAGHEQPFYYHTLVLLVGCFPASFLALAAIKRNEFYTYRENLFRTVMGVLFLVVLILFSIVKTKIVHYSSLCWLPLTFLSAYAIESINNGIFKLKWYLKTGMIVMGYLLSIFFMAIPFIMMNYREDLADLIKDDFSKALVMADVKWTSIEMLPGLLMFLIISIFIVLLFKARSVIRFGFLLVGTCIFTWITAKLLIPKAESQLQGYVVNFLESKQKEDCYIFHVGYKSYAPYFYADIKPLDYVDGLNLQTLKYYRLHAKGKTFLQLTEKQKADLDDWQKDWLMTGPISKSAYFVCKISNRENLAEAPKLKLIEEKNGFAIYKREPEF